MMKKPRSHDDNLCSHSEKNVDKKGGVGESSELWRQHGRKRRSALLCEDDARGGSLFSMNKALRIQRYYEIATRAMDRFLDAFNRQSDIEETYVMGHRLLKFLSAALPRHDDFGSEKADLVALRKNSEDDLIILQRSLEDLALQIDEKELNKFLLRDLVNKRKAQNRKQRGSRESRKKREIKIEPSESSLAPLPIMEIEISTKRNRQHQPNSQAFNTSGSINTIDISPSPEQWPEASTSGICNAKSKLTGTPFDENDTQWESFTGWSAEVTDCNLEDWILTGTTKSSHNYPQSKSKIKGENYDFGHLESWPASFPSELRSPATTGEGIDTHQEASLSFEEDEAQFYPDPGLEDVPSDSDCSWTGPTCKKGKDQVDDDTLSETSDASSDEDQLIHESLDEKNGTEMVRKCGLYDEDGDTLSYYDPQEERTSFVERVSRENWDQAAIEEFDSDAEDSWAPSLIGDSDNDVEVNSAKPSTESKLQANQISKATIENDNCEKRKSDNKKDRFKGPPECKAKEETKSEMEYLEGGQTPNKDGIQHRGYKNSGKLCMFRFRPRSMTTLKQQKKTNSLADDPALAFSGSAPETIILTAEV